MRTIIVAGMIFLPCLLNAQSLHISRNASLVVHGDASIVLNDAAFINDGNFIAGNGAVVFTGNALKSMVVIGGASKTSFTHLHINRTFNQVILNNHISVNGILTMNAGNLELNNHRLDLGRSGIIVGEQINSRITGAQGGIVTATAILSSPKNANPGNIGVEISSDSNLGLTLVTRGHMQQVNAGGATGIQRYYDIQPSYNATNVTLRLYYLEPELAGNNESELVLWSSVNSAWTTVGKESSDANTNWLTKNNISGLSRFTLGISDKAASMSALPKARGSALRAGSIQAYPNPARDRVMVALYSETEKTANISLQDPLGRVLERRQVQFSKGMNSLQWNIAKYATGTYYLVFENTGLGNLEIVKQN